MDTVSSYSNHSAAAKVKHSPKAEMASSSHPQTSVCKSSESHFIADAAYPLRFCATWSFGRKHRPCATLDRSMQISRVSEEYTLEQIMGMTEYRYII